VLVWLPGNAPKPGFEEQFTRIIELTQANPERDHTLLWNRFEEVSISPFETLAVPRVGFDERATAWAIAQHATLGDGVPLEEWLIEHAGHFVCELLPPCDGVPLGALTSGPLSFRAALLTGCEEIIGADRLAAAVTPQLAPQLLVYGVGLRNAAIEFAERLGIPIPPPPPAEFDPNVDDSPTKVRIVLAAARWCTFWADRGHMVCPEF
jgi:hypothetical protein